jgi:enoyl-[acyl-carrier protein] reductase I
MNDVIIRPILAGRKTLVVGFANEHSIAYGCAKALREAGSDLAVTWLNEKAKPYVEPLVQERSRSQLEAR